MSPSSLGFRLLKLGHRDSCELFPDNGGGGGESPLDSEKELCHSLYPPNKPNFGWPKVEEKLKCEKGEEKRGVNGGGGDVREGDRTLQLMQQQLSQSPPPPEDQARLLITTDDKLAEDQENQNEKHYSEQTVVPESEDEEADKQTMRTPCVRKPTPAKKTTREPPHPHGSSYSDRGTDSDTHLGSRTTTSGFVIEPLASEPVDVVPPQPEKPTSCKRRLMPEFEKNAGELRDKKKAKVVEKKKSGVSAINRLWSEEDEVLILKGLMDFQSKKGSDPYPDMGEFYELIKQSLSVDASRNQFLDKIRKLKRKYSTNNAEKGERAIFSRPHEHKCFELSNKIWGDGGRKEDTGVDGNGKNVSARARKTQENRKEVALGEKAKELEKKWQIWHADEAALHLRREELIEEQKKLTLDAIKASKVVEQKIKIKASKEQGVLWDGITGSRFGGLFGNGI
ncbi:probable transcription factor At1g61730 [Rhododendron vialii]|uniref:probable transcription factor At1g61730 n=1 Tax=Rhododendron vialii TaxID=182163 RepID=UPI00265E57A8|nr:probable transcription factor At1g61730 [Rhododendron vialii]